MFSFSAAPVARFPRTRLLDVELSSLELMAVKPCDGGNGFGFRRHFDEAETPGVSAELVPNGRGRFDDSESLESRPQPFVGRFVSQIAYIDVHVLRLSLVEVDNWVSTVSRPAQSLEEDPFRPKDDSRQ